MKEIQGDLIELAINGEFDYIIHGCNCFNTMGSGIAYTVRHAFPQAWIKDQRTVKGTANKLGKYTLATEKIKGGKVKVINLYTQYHPGPNFRLAALEIGLFTLINTINDFHPSSKVRVGIPLIGAGIGGGSWVDIKNTLLRELDPFCELTVVHYNK